MGPSLAGRNVEDLKVAELKHWLSIVRATTKGKTLTDFSKLCDFCIYTTTGVAVDHIYPDLVWQDIYCPELDSCFSDNIFPELLSPMNKHNYYL